MKRNEFAISKIEAFFLTFHPLLITIGGIIFFQRYLQNMNQMTMPVMIGLFVIVFCSIALFLFFRKNIKTGNKFNYVLRYLFAALAITSLFIIYLKFDRVFIPGTVKRIIAFTRFSFRTLSGNRLINKTSIETTFMVITIFWINLSVQIFFLLKRQEDLIRYIIYTSLISIAYFFTLITAIYILPFHIIDKNPVILYIAYIPLTFLLFIFLIDKEKHSSKITHNVKTKHEKKNIRILSNAKGNSGKIKKQTSKIKSKKQSASEQRKYDVFLAHNSLDKPDVKKIARVLRKRGIVPWIDEEQIPPGGRIQSIIQETVNKIKTAAVIIGSSGIGKWQAFELEVFISLCVRNNVPVIPVLLPGTNSIPNRLPFLQLMNYVNFTNTVLESEGLKNLEWGIKGKK